MYGVCIFITILCLANAILLKSCLEVKLEHEKHCQISNLRNYVDCVRTRMKRHSYNCKYDEDCFDCDCEFCQYSQCDGQCSDCCNSCCANYVRCHTNHCCHKQCHSECRTYNCRSSCRKACYDSISRETTEKEVVGEVVERAVERTIEENGGVNNNLQCNTSNANTHNITTVINLKNVINNTNLIDVPINLNYTNRNNISLTEVTKSHDGSSGSIPDGFPNDQCCIVIGPRQCDQIQISPYVRCFHLRSRQCGSFCTATVVHKEYPSCTINSFGQRVCQDEAAYIPQPQPKCTYSNMWPYVTCAVQNLVSCEGCYGHYFNSQAKEYKSCSPQCYDDFGAGPLYRQGPFYQPTYSHMPPCYLSPQGCGFPGFGGSGNFGMIGAYEGGFGGYMGGLGPGFGGGFGNAAQLPMLPYGPSFPQPQPVAYIPQLPGYFTNLTSNNQTVLNSSDDQLLRHRRHLGHRKAESTDENTMEHTYTTTVNSHPAHRDILDEIIIDDEYQADREVLLVPLYELPDQEVKIDVRIIDPNKKQHFKLPFMKNELEEQNELKEVIKDTQTD